MQPERKKGIFIRSIILVAGLFILTTGSLAQLTVSAEIQATIVTPDDISAMSLSSADGTQFILQNGVNSCFDLTVTGLPPLLESTNGSQKVNYLLNLEHWQSHSFDVTRIQVNVLFNKTVKEGTYLAANPYSISVNYN